MVRNFYDSALNEDLSRNLLNTEKRKYNCAGFALGTFNWYVPCSEKYEDYIEFCITLDEKKKLYVKHLLNDFKGSLRRIESLDEIKEDEYGIAFKAGMNDFHFVKIMTPTIAYEKVGASKIRRFSIEDVMARYWRNGYYCTETILFAKKKDTYPKPKKDKAEDSLARAC